MKNSAALFNITTIILILGWACTISSKRTLLERNTKRAQDSPIIGNVTCHDSNFQRTLTWLSHNVSNNLRLLYYNVRFCATVECNIQKYKALCYNDERKSEVAIVNTTYCKISIHQLTTFSYDTFFVRGVYRDLSANKTIRTKNAIQNCRPIEDASSLSPPTMLTHAEPYALDIELFLPNELQEAFKEIESPSTALDLRVTYFFCVAENKNECLNGSRTKKSLNSELRYPLPLRPDTDYVVLGWYTVLGEFLLTSEVMTEVMRTSPGPFPHWAQILLICSAAALIIIVIISALGGKYVYAKSSEAKADIRRPLTQFLEDTIKEVGLSGNNRFLLISYRSNVTTSLEEEQFYIPLIERQAKSLTEESKTSFRESTKMPETGTTRNHDTPSVRHLIEVSDLSSSLSCQDLRDQAQNSSSFQSERRRKVTLPDMGHGAKRKDLNSEQTAAIDDNSDSLPDYFKFRAEGISNSNFSYQTKCLLHDLPS